MGPRKRYPATICIFIPLFLLFLISCSLLRQDKTPDRDKIDWSKKTPAGVLDELKSNQKGIRDLTAHFSISLDPPPEGKFSNLQGIFIFERAENGPRIRIKAMAPFGRVMFDLVQKGNSMEIYVPSRNTLYRGDIHKGSPEGNAWGSALMGMFEDFSAVEAAEGAEFVISDDFAVLPLTDGALKFDIKSGYLVGVSRKEKTTLYGRYEHTAGPYPIPTHIEIISKGGSQRVECSLSQICMNCDPGDVFHLDIYNPGFTKDLDEIDQ